ncbi:MAG: SIMPL domain-containing protein [Candidatus Poribacteria bacterium]|nr:SIMPL domain-containing protein [Candidatus Poribacteria bacterium]
MRGKFWVFLAFLLIVLPGCGGDKTTGPEEELDLTSPELAPLLNTQAGRQFAEAPWDTNKDGAIDVLDLILVAQHFGEDVEEPSQEKAVLEIINRDEIGRTIQVTGNGSVFDEPDIVVLNLGVSVERQSVKEAREEAADAMQKVIDSLKDNGVLEQDLQTQQFSIQQQFDFTDGRREFRGYRVTNNVSAKVRDLDTIGQTIDDAAEAGGDLVQIQSIRFGIDDTTALRELARKNAMQDAQAKATTLATAGGVELGKPISIIESSGSFVPPFAERGFGEADALSSTPIETGQLQVTVTVSVVYEIK